MPSEPNGGIEFNAWSAIGVSEAVAPADGGYSKGQTSANPHRSIEQQKKRTPPATAVSTRKKGPDCRRSGISGGKPKEVSVAASTTATKGEDGKPTQGRRPGKAVRRPWGAGPGVTAASVARDPSRPRAKTSREGQTGGKACKGNGHFGVNARPPPPHSSAQERETSPLGPTLEQFLPTWTSLVAEAAWLRGAEATARTRSWVSRGGGEGDLGGGESGGGASDGGCDEQSGADGIGDAAPPISNGERFDDTTSASSGFRSRSAEHPRQPAGMPGSSSPTLERGNPPQESVGGERHFKSKRRGSGGSKHQGCDVPAPSLDPSVERVLMDWLKSRIDRYGNGTVNVAFHRCVEYVCLFCHLQRLPLPMRFAAQKELRSLCCRAVGLPRNVISLSCVYACAGCLVVRCALLTLLLAHVCAATHPPC